MNKVSFSSKTQLDKEELKTQLTGQLMPGEPVLVKLHFGEPGNPHAFTPASVRPLVEALQELGFKVTLTDTPVTYPSPRNSKVGYEQVVTERGYRELCDCYIEDQYVKQTVGDLEFEVAKNLTEAKNLIILTHVKGHECAGFGGAIKNLGMGALSPASKAMIHDICKPVIDPDLCIGCSLCSQVCPAKAIDMVEGKALPDLNRCWGCSICQLVCPQKALQPKLKLFDEALAMGAVAAIKLMPSKTIYINVVNNIAKSCDCEGHKMPILAKDLGILYAQSAVAIDQASLDLLNKAAGENVFQKANHKDPYLQVKYAAEYSGEKLEYELQ